MYQVVLNYNTSILKKVSDNDHSWINNDTSLSQCMYCAPHVNQGKRGFVSGDAGQQIQISSALVASCCIFVHQSIIIIIHDRQNVLLLSFFMRSGVACCMLHHDAVNEVRRSAWCVMRKFQHVIDPYYIEYVYLLWGCRMLL